LSISPHVSGQCDAQSPVCGVARQEARSSAAKYLRVNLGRQDFINDLASSYDSEKRETTALANNC
jgi:hypothetical protein